VFLKHHTLLSSLGEGELSEEKVKEVEEFVCKMYKLDSIGSVDKAQAILFSKKGKPEALPPTSDALSLHVKRVHYQAIVWKQAHCTEPHLPDPETLGWKKIADNKLQPLLMTQDPIPKACKEIISCSCSTGCSNLRCSCKKLNCFVPVFVGANRTMSIYIPLKTLPTNELSDALENMMCVPLMKRKSSS